MTLLVVLLSAAPTGEQAQMRLVGSAFDPAATSVTLGPKLLKSKISVALKRSVPSPDLAPPVPALALLWPAREFLPPPRVAGWSPWAVVLAPAPNPPPLGRAHRSRAPPPA